jgi:hypothetical protein
VPGPACSASSASFTHSSANTRHVTLLTSSTAASARRRHCSEERRQRAGKFSVSWTALTGPSRRRCLVRRNRRLLWPALASRRDTCAAVREPSRDWLPGRHGSPAGTCQDLLIATFDWPLGPSPDWRRATCGGPSRRFSGSLYGTDPRGAGGCLWFGDHDVGDLADRAVKSPFPATVVARRQNAEMHSHIAGLAFRAGNTGLGGRLHVDGYPRGPGWIIAVSTRGHVDFSTAMRSRLFFGAAATDRRRRD